MINPHIGSPFAELIHQTAHPWLVAGTAGIDYDRPKWTQDWVLRLYPRSATGALALVASIAHEGTGLYGFLRDGKIEYGPLEVGLGEQATLVELVKAILHGKIEESFSTLFSWGWGRRIRWDGEEWGVMYPAFVMLLPVQHKRYGSYDAPQ